MALPLFFLAVGFILVEAGIWLSRYHSTSEQWVAGAVTAIMGVLFTVGAILMAVVLKLAAP